MMDTDVMVGTEVSSLKRARTPSPEVPNKMAPVKDLIEQNIKDNNVMVFSKSTCPFCKKVKELFKSLNVTFYALEIDLLDNGSTIQDKLKEMTEQRTVPNVFIHGKHIGGADATMKLHTDGKLMELIMPPSENYTYDLIVIGGGSGGLACSKEAAIIGKKVAVLDFVKPSPIGTTWGLGGTCVNVGCIPKKLMHQAAILGNLLQQVTIDKKGREGEMTAQHIVLATGLRPRYPDIPGAREYGITSDDLFSLENSPGKTVIIGASYVALECAGFLAGIKLDVTVLVRSILLRGFDQQMAELIGNDMISHGIKVKRPSIPTKIELIEEGTPRKLRVYYKHLDSGEEGSVECNTVMFAIGRDPCTQGIGLENVGVKLNPKNGKVIAGDNEQTSVPNIFGVGDIMDGKLELTPVAIQAGRLLARRLYGGQNELCDYVNVATTVFTPLEYGCIGLSEEDAIARFGEENVEVYHTNYQPLEYTVAKRDVSGCYAKLVCNKSDNERVVGFHVLGPNAGEVTQGYAVAIKLGATKKDFDRTIGIHPTVSEVSVSTVRFSLLYLRK
ncbi:hypothetical protein pdam_00018521, partial [Pocillopora damicornis]